MKRQLAIAALAATLTAGRAEAQFLDAYGRPTPHPAIDYLTQERVEIDVAYVCDESGQDPRCYSAYGEWLACGGTVDELLAQVVELQKQLAALKKPAKAKR